MKYYIEKTINGTFNQTVEKIIATLPQIGFGIVTEFNVDEKLNEKLGVNFRKYKILGACNPKYAYDALKAEPLIGTMLPCNIVVQELEPGLIQVAAIDPVASMLAVENPVLNEAALAIKQKLADFIDKL